MRVDFRLRESAVELWQEVKQRLCWASGRWVVSDEQVIYQAALAFLVTYLPLWLHEVEHGDPIAVRDRFQCLVPGCTNRCGSPHHLRFRSQGGPDDAWNLSFMCHTHHLELLHQRGFIRVHGRAPDDLVFELGIRPDGTAVEVFVNEERVGGPAIRIPGVTTEDFVNEQRGGGPVSRIPGVTTEDFVYEQRGGGPAVQIPGVTTEDFVYEQRLDDQGNRNPGFDKVAVGDGSAALGSPPCVNKALVVCGRDQIRAFRPGL